MAWSGVGGGARSGGHSDRVGRRQKVYYKDFSPTRKQPANKAATILRPPRDVGSARVLINARIFPRTNQTRSFKSPHREQLLALSTLPATGTCLDFKRFDKRVIALNFLDFN